MESEGGVAEDILETTAWLKEGVSGLQCGFGKAQPRQSDWELAQHLGGIWGEGASVPVQLLTQPHGTAWLETGEVVGYDAQGQALPCCDGAVGWLEDGRGLRLGIKTADCVPILLVDGKQGLYAGLHLGWRGTAKGFLSRLLQHWKKEGGLQQVRLAMGPHICGCCFQVGTECLDQFPSRWLEGAVKEHPGGYWLNLAAVLRTQAKEYGLANEQIRQVDQCSFCETNTQGEKIYASYRRHLLAKSALPKVLPPSTVNLSWIGPA